MSCDPGPVSAQTRRPKLPSFTTYEPRATVQSTNISATGLFTSCRSLQAALGTALPPSPIARSRSLLNPFDQPIPSKGVESNVAKTPPSRGLKKRNRDDFEDDSSDVEPQRLSTFTRSSGDKGYSTPKRKRRTPLSMPFGLSAQDFHDLNTISSPIKLHLPVEKEAWDKENILDDDSGYGPSPTEADPGWTIEDDRMLVETVLEKLKLSKNDWNDCARVLGKNKDTLGRRWKILIGEGNVGLRRSGRIRRTDLDIRSWQ